MQREPFKNSLGFTQEEIAVLLGITRSQWSMYESGKRDISIEAKQKLIALLTAAKESKTSSTNVQKIIALENKAVVLELQKLMKEKQYLLELVEQKLKVAEKIRQESFAALKLIRLVKKMPLFTASQSALITIQNRSEKQLKKYSEKHLMHLQLKKETINHQLVSMAKKTQDYSNEELNDLV